MRELPPDTHHSPEKTLKECFEAAPPAPVAAQTFFGFRNLIYLELAKGFEPLTL
jgi:hypothetical protein